MTDSPTPGPQTPGPQTPGPWAPGPQTPGPQTPAPQTHGPWAPRPQTAGSSPQWPPGGHESRSPAPARSGAPGTVPPWYAAAGYLPPGSAAAPGGYQPPRAAPPRQPVIVRVQPVGGTPYAFGYVKVPPVTSGLAIGSLTTGTASIIVSLGMSCLGLAGASDGWGALVAGAFAILSVLLGIAGLVFGRSARRIIRRSAGSISGRGVATAGIVCGSIGVGLSALGFVIAVLATISA